jgi:hypothetical protein
LCEHYAKKNNNGTLLACLSSYSLCSWPLRNQFPQPQSSQELETAGLKTTSCEDQAINRVFKTKFQNISGAKGYSKERIKEELINPLIVITRLITCEGRYSVFKAYHFRLLAHFQFNKPLNFPFYFLKSLKKMSSQVRKNVTNPHNNLFHHGLIKLLVLDELRKTWDEFIYQF